LRQLSTADLSVLSNRRLLTDNVVAADRRAIPCCRRIIEIRLPGKLNVNPEENVMSTTVIERELSEQTFTALWKYVKCILRMHVAGIVDEAEADRHAQSAEDTEQTS